MACLLFVHMNVHFAKNLLMDSKWFVSIVKQNLWLGPNSKEKAEKYD